MNAQAVHESFLKEEFNTPELEALIEFLTSRCAQLEATYGSEAMAEEDQRLPGI